jgi:UDP-glucose 4-epimerase
MKRILITGAKGYIGQSIYNTFSSTYDITCISREDFDLTDSDALSNFFFIRDKFDIVIHCAVKGGNRLIEDDYSIMDINLTMYYNLLHHQGKDFDKLIHFGSGAEVLWTDRPYGFSKYIIAKSSFERDNCYNLRIYGLFDSNELDRRFIKGNMQRYLNNKPMLVHQDKFMDFFYMKDLLNLLEVYINSDKNLPKEIECCYKRPFTLVDIAEIINTLDTHKVDIKIEKKSLGDAYTGGNLEHGLIKPIGLERGIVEMYKELKNEY